MWEKNLLAGLTIYRRLADHPVVQAWQKLLEAVDGAELAQVMEAYHHFSALASHYQKVGCGFFGRYGAARWQKDDSQGRLQGIPHPDPIQLDQLVLARQ